MRILYGPNYKVKEDTVISFGKFDGIHKGHIKLINTLVDEAKKGNMISVVYTFENHPKSVLKNEDINLLMNNDEKADKINKLGVDVLVFEHFSKDYANITPENFVKDILLGKLNVKKIVIGSNSTFGKDSLGNVELLKSLAKKYGFEVVEIPLVKENGIVISSTEMRKELALRGGNAK